MSTKVTLRRKKISNNRESLYLDFYPPIEHPKTGEPTRREFLKMFLFSPVKVIQQKRKTGIKEILVYSLDPAENDKYIIHNNETLAQAEQIKQNRQNAINKPEIYSPYEKEILLQKKLKTERQEASFIEYFQKLADKRKSSNHDNWISTLNYLKKFTNGELKFGQLTEGFCKDFKKYLLTIGSIKNKKVALSQNSVFSYFNKFKASLKQAYKDGLLDTDLNSKISRVKPLETHRNFLTVEELNRLVQTQCNVPVLKQAALFSALTGLRFSDINNLAWEDVELIKGQGYFLKFTQKKTEKAEMMPISEQAFSFLGEPGEPGEKVFADLKYSAWLNTQLFKWLTNAGITKEITFHCFRHTYAVLQLSLGTDIYTLSKMLGHRELKTTQIYAKVIDPAKRKAADKIKLDLPKTIE